MELSSDELDNLLMKRSSDAVEIDRLKQQLSAVMAGKEMAEKEAAEWRKKAEDAEAALFKSNMENSYLKDYIMLSIDKIRKYMNSVSDLRIMSLLHTFMIKALPDAFMNKCLPIIDDLTSMPKSNVPITITADSVSMPISGLTEQNVDFNGSVGQVINHADNVEPNIT